MTRNERDAARDDHFAEMTTLVAEAFRMRRSSFAVSLSLRTLVSVGLAPLVLTSLVAATAPPAKPARPAAPTPGVRTGSEFPAEWFWDIGGALSRFAPLLGKAPPPLTVKDWIGTPTKPADHIGKVVVVDFWATWCGPCMKALPEMNALAKEHPNDVVVIGVHDAARGSDKMASVAKSKDIVYAMAIDDGGKSASAWKVSYWPTIGVIDRAGNLRALGVIPEHVKAVVEKLLKEAAPAIEKGAKPATGPSGKPSAAPSGTPVAPPATAPADAPKSPPKSALASPPPSAPTVAPPTKPATPPAAAPAPKTFTEGDPARVKSLEPLVGKSPPAIESAEWANTTALKLDELKGKVVLLDFWATWCGPCIQSIPHNNELFERYKDKVVVIGVCHPRGGDQMSKVVTDKGIKYPVCRLTDETVLKAYMVDSYPDYYLIDKKGDLRIVDCANGRVDEAIEMLVKE